MSNPTTRNIEAYFGNTYGLVYVFETSAGGAFDIASNFSTLSLKIFTKNNEASPLVELDLDSGFTISDTNRLVGEITAAQNETLFGSPIKYYQMTVTYNGDTETILKGIYVVNRAQSGSANDTALTLTVSLAPLEVSVSVADNAFLALQAKNETQEIVSQVSPSRAGISYATKVDMDNDTTQINGTTGIVANDTAANNGFYRWDGTSWVKRANFYVSVVDPIDESEAVNGKAVGDYVNNLISIEPITNPNTGFTFFSQPHNQFLTWNGSNYVNNNGIVYHVPFYYRDASINVTLDGTKVDSWDDVYSKNTDEIFIPFRPDLEENVINGKSAILFDGVDDYLIPNNRDLIETTIYLVVNAQESASDMRLISFVKDSNHFLQLQIDDELKEFYGFARTTIGNFSNTKGLLNNWCVIGFRVNSGKKIQSFMNNVFGDVTIIDNFGSVTGNEWIFGAGRNKNSNYYKGYVAEWLMFDSYLENQEHDDVINSLLKKYNIEPTKYSVIGAGQSNMEGRGDSAESPNVASGVAFEFSGSVDAGFSITELNDPVGGADTGSLAPSFVNTLFSRTKEPIYYIESAKGGAALLPASAGSNGNWDKNNGDLFSDATKSINSLINDGGDLKVILWCQGERDAQAFDDGTFGVTRFAYKNALIQLIKNFKIYYPKTPFCIIQTGRLNSGDTLGWQMVREVQLEVCQQMDNVFMLYDNAVNFEGLGWMDDDGLHWNQDGLNDVGEKSAINFINQSS